MSNRFFFSFVLSAAAFFALLLGVQSFGVLLSVSPWLPVAPAALVALLITVSN